MKPTALHGLACLAAAAVSACAGTPAAPLPPPVPVAAADVVVPDGTLRVAHGVIQSPTGKPFVMRGINLQYGDDPGARLPMIDEIADTGANTVRLQLRRDTSARQLRAALDRIVARNLVAVLMYWEDDVTCRSGTAGMRTALKHWTDTWHEVLVDPKYRAHLVLNIANEWGEPDAQDTFGNIYRAAVVQLRAAGYAFPLMIDAAHCGQNYSVFAKGGATRIAEVDRYRNLIFSTHAYWSYQTLKAIDDAVAAVRDQGLAFVWGEFGQKAFQADIGQATDHRHLVSQAEATGVSYIAWSWYGNGADARALDMRDAGSKPTLTTYGHELVEGGTSFKGIRATAVPAGS